MWKQCRVATSNGYLIQGACLLPSLPTSHFLKFYVDEVFPTSSTPYHSQMPGPSVRPSVRLSRHTFSMAAHRHLIVLSNIFPTTEFIPLLILPVPIKSFFPTLLRVRGNTDLDEIRRIETTRPQFCRQRSISITDIFPHSLHKITHQVVLSRSMYCMYPHRHPYLLNLFSNKFQIITINLFHCQTFSFPLNSFFLTPCDKEYKIR